MATYWISYFQQLRYMTDSATVIIDTSYKAPYWLDPSNGTKQHLNENNILIGIKEPSFLMTEDETPEEMCSGRPCPYEDKKPCQFLKTYWNHLQKIDFDGYLIPELSRIAEDVRKITHYEGEPKIVLMVHEKPDNPCSERGPLIRLFKEHGIELKEWTKEDTGIVF